MSKDTPFCQCNQCVPPSMLMKILGAVGKAFLGMLVGAVVLGILWGIVWVIFKFQFLTVAFAILWGAALIPCFGYAAYILGRDVWDAIRRNHE